MSKKRELTLGMILWPIVGLTAFTAFLSGFTDVVEAIDEKKEVQRRVRVEYWQDADSARYVVSWIPGPMNARQRGIAYWDVRIVSTVALVANDSVAQDTTEWLTDTLAVAYPPLDSSMSLKAIVRGVSSTGLIGDWRESTIFTLTSTELPPSPPDSLVADTLAFVLDVELRPTVVTLSPGDTQQFCSIIIMSNGVTGLALNHQSGPSQLECEAVYQRWLTEVGA